MAIFFVVAEQSNESLGAKIASLFPNDHFQLTGNQWFVSTEKLTVDLAEQIQVRKGEFGRVMVVKIDGYAGFHNKNCWEWLALKGGAK